MVLFYNENGMKRIAAIAAALLIGFGPVAHAVSHAGDGGHGCQTCQAIRSPVPGAVVALTVRAHVFAEMVVSGEFRLDLPLVAEPSRPRGPPL
jgi:hypothetical protein